MGKVCVHDHEIRSILASLFYLSQEAEIIGLSQISKIIDAAICKVHEWLEDQNSNFNDLIIDEQTLYIMKFLFQYSQVSDETGQRFINIIEQLDKIKSFSH